MMLSAHANLLDETEEWTRLRFSTCQVAGISFPKEEEVTGPSDGCLRQLSGPPQSQEESTTMSEDQEQNKQESSKGCAVEMCHPVVNRQLSESRKGRILEKRVSFPSDDSMLVQNLEPPNIDIPEVLLSESPEFDPIDTYTLSCKKNSAEPVESIVEQLKNVDLGRPRSNSLTLRGLKLDSRDCESLEDVFKNIPLKMLDLAESNPDDDGIVALFDMVEFYEAATHVSIAANKNMSNRGWQACCRMIKRSECLEWLDAAGIALSEHTSTLLARALRSNSRLRVLFLNGCNLSGRSFYTIANSLKLNHNLRELHLAENKLNSLDALQLGILLTGNESIQHVDLRNNEIQDQGMIYLCEALQDNTGLNTLVVWNNGITRESTSALAKALAVNKTLQTLNLGHNNLDDDGVISFIADGLKNNRSLLHLGLQANGLTSSSIVALAEVLATGNCLQRVDLRKNSLDLAGLQALASTLKHCPSLTQVDLSKDFEGIDESVSSEMVRLMDEISKACAENEAAKGESATDHSSNGKATPESWRLSVSEDKVSRKVSLTCLVPPTDGIGLTLPLSPTKEEDEGAERVPRKWRSPLPSPMPSPSRSPLPSPCSRFKVTRVESDVSPLPSPRSRFTVTPVDEFPMPNPGGSALASSVTNRNDNNDNGSQDCASLIRSSPSKDDKSGLTANRINNKVKSKRK